MSRPSPGGQTAGAATTASAPRWLAVLLALMVIGLGAWWAASAWWTTDDAFISFRYASNLVNGSGLVFNEGERVEGYTNPLWTLWIAAGLALGFGAEPWANGWGLACYLGSILLLAANHFLLARRQEGAVLVVPLAALMASLHRDWSIYATSGLETSAFTFLLLAGFLVAVWNLSRPGRLAAAGALFALASLTRPDGILPALVTGLFVLLAAKPRARCAALYASGFLALWLPLTIWRVGYYGEFFPNTYYAKSAYLPWYDQGWRYLALYLEKYWVLALGPVMLVAATFLPGSRGAPGDAAGRPVRRDQIVLAASIAAVYAFYVVRVGGDFMFARLLIPATPFLLLLLELGWTGLFRGRLLAGLVAAFLACAAILLSPTPVTGTKWRHGVADEWRYYSPELVAQLDHWAEVLGRYFDGLPVRVAFYGDEARIVYKAAFPVAIESHSGLTDRAVARQELHERGRAGHEKLATARYLIEDRKIHFTFSNVPRKELRLKEQIPEVIVRFDEGVYGQALHWDPAIMDELRRRGAFVPDFVGFLDRYVGRIPEIPPEQLAKDYRRFKRFYFDHVDDEEREQAFLTDLPSATR